MAHVSSKEQRLLKKALARSRACATIEELGGLAGGSLAPAVSTRVRDHLATCPRCQAELALLNDFEAAAPRPAEEAAVSWISARLERQFAGSDSGAASRSDAVEPWWRRWLTFPSLRTAGFAFATAMLVVAVGIGVREARDPAFSPPSSVGAPVFRSGELTAMSPAGDLDQPPAELRWQPWPAAAKYSVRLMEVDRAEIWSAETQQESLPLPAAIRARIVPGKPLLWQVVAKDGAGGTLASSAVQRFRLKRQP